MHSGVTMMQAAMVLRSGHRSRPPKERGGSGYPTPICRWGRTNQPRPLYLYVVYCKEFAKIGVTENIKTRVSAMQGGNPYLIELIHSVALEKEIAIKAENAVMLELNDVHWFGDWFKTSRSHARFVVDSVVKKLQAKPAESEAASVKYPGMKRKVIAPDGRVFDSCAQAAAAVGISRQAMHMRLFKQFLGWKWSDE